MDEVRIAQNRVLEAESRFITAQENRRESNKTVSQIQNKLKDLYAELDNTNRGEERYVHLITQEHKLLKEEKRLVAEFQRLEGEERDYFSALSSAVKDSHEKERAQAERTKYWSIIGSVIGTVIGVVGSSINNELKMKEIRKLVTQSLVKQQERDDLSNAIPESLSKHEKELSVIISEIKSVTNLQNDEGLSQLSKLIHSLDNKINMGQLTQPENGDVVSLLKKQEIMLENNFKELKLALRSLSSVGQVNDGQLIVVPFEFEEKFLDQQRQSRNIMVASAAVIMLVPILLRYLGLA
uniref:Coiled-coil domain-containing protein 51 n=2 Tax=Timema TaxID=61471 RepID=A0A7R9AX74_TIMSH|nr:unnamed protein product [Timema shepardi]CAD7572576.1 unnamed protein product [Timema californicum]